MYEVINRLLIRPLSTFIRHTDNKHKNDIKLGYGPASISVLRSRSSGIQHPEYVDK